MTDLMDKAKAIAGHGPNTAYISRALRAIKRWQEAHPGNELIWPDHADLCVWLLEQLDQKTKEEQ